MKINLGCGADIREGYVNIDLYNDKADVKMDVTKLEYENDSIDEVLAYHMIEHFHFQKGMDVLREWNRVLKPGGMLKIETPDFLNLCGAFVAASEQDRVGFYGHFFAKPWVPGETHYFLFTETQLRWQLQQTGFENIVRVEPDSSYYKERNRANPEFYLNLEAKKIGQIKSSFAGYSGGKQ